MKSVPYVTTDGMIYHIQALKNEVLISGQYLSYFTGKTLYELVKKLEPKCQFSIFDTWVGYSEKRLISCSCNFSLHLYGAILLSGTFLL